MKFFELEDVFFLTLGPFQSMNSDSRRQKSFLPRLGGTSGKHWNVNG